VDFHLTLTTTRNLYQSMRFGMQTASEASIPKTLLDTLYHADLSKPGDRPFVHRFPVRIVSIFTFALLLFTKLPVLSLSQTISRDS
jgi:hypothetical protein